MRQRRGALIIARERLAAFARFARVGTSRAEFHQILAEEELADAVVLVYANKQDVPGALTEAQITEGLGLADIKDRQWAIFKTSAIKGEGLWEGMEWLSNTLRARG